MDNISTISELLGLSGSQYRIYDLGRKIDKISKEQFNKVELNQVPYPFPSQGHAFIAIAFWQKQSPAPYLWFVKLPLDERGLLNQGARNHFIAIIIEALGGDLTVNPSEKQEELLKSNPYHFTPAQYKLASINSQLKYDLKKDASIYFEHCQHYFHGQLDWNEWQSVGVQGIADYACRINDNGNTEALVAALPHLPLEVLQPLCSALENQELPVALIEALISFYDSLSAEQTTERTFVLRALASNCKHPYVEKLIDDNLSANALSDEQLITLAGRCWTALETPARLSAYLEVLVKADEPGLFPAIFKDLVAIPTIRPILFQCMRAPERSEALAKAIGALFNTVK